MKKDEKTKRYNWRLEFIDTNPHHKFIKVNFMWDLIYCICYYVVV